MPEKIDKNPIINWYPGHMHKAKKELSKQLKSVDIVLEMRDARIPISSTNYDLEELFGQKKRILLFNKTSLSDAKITNKWNVIFLNSETPFLFIDALKKMTIMPAQRLEKRAPIFKKKGRLQVGAHADIVTFNPNTIIDTSSYTNPTSPPNGISNVLVGGNHLIHNKTIITNQYPGTGILSSST